MDQSKIDSAIAEWKSYPRLDIPPIIMRCSVTILQEVKQNPAFTTYEEQVLEVKRIMEEAIPAEKTGDELISIKNRISYVTK